MRADLLQSPASASNVVVLDNAAFRGGATRETVPLAAPSPLSWRTCLSAWIGLSAVSWGAVLLIASQLR